MSFTFELTMAPRLGLEVSPALVAFGELLMLPHQAMAAAIEDEIVANPALERLEDGECPLCRGRGGCPACAARQRGPDVNLDRAQPESDRDRLLRDVRLVSKRPAVAELVLNSLDEHGLLDRSPSTLARELRLPAETVEEALAAIRLVGPPGVGATSVVECLLLQLDELSLGDGLASLLRRLIISHLPAVARGQLAAVAGRLGVPRETVQDALCLMRNRLRPYPEFDGGPPRVRYVVPDLIVCPSADGQYTVQVVDQAVYRLQVRRSCAPAEYRHRAQAFLAQLHDRWQTMHAVAEYAVCWQQAFIREGPGSIRPLTRTQVAGALGLHESTVSRAVAEKYVLLPDRRTISLAILFARSGAIDETLRRLIQEADSPLTDARLAELLREAGFDVARRTVAKHRARLGIPAASVR